MISRYVDLRNKRAIYVQKRRSEGQKNNKNPNIASSQYYYYSIGCTHMRDKEVLMLTRAVVVKGCILGLRCLLQPAHLLRLTATASLHYFFPTTLSLSLLIHLILSSSPASLFVVSPLLETFKFSFKFSISFLLTSCLVLAHPLSFSTYLSTPYQSATKVRHLLLPYLSQPTVCGHHEQLGGCTACASSLL